MKIGHLLFLLLPALEVVAARGSIFKDVSTGQVIVTGCLQVLASQATYCSTTTTSSSSSSHHKRHSSTSTCYCTDINYEGSLIYCGYQIAKNEKEKEEFNDYLVSLCPSLDSDDFESVYENVTNYLVNTSTVADFSSTTIINYPIYFDVDATEAYVRSILFYNRSWNDGVYFGGALIAYFVGVFFLAGLNFWTKKLFPRKIMAVSRTLQKNILVRLVKKYIVVPAFLNGTHTVPIRFIAGYWPTRVESIVIGIFYFLSLLFHCINYGYHTEGSSYYGTKSEYLTHFIADRSGIISTFMIILTFFMAGRNNIFLWWTGWKQSTFFAIHKAVARVCVLSAVVHTITFTILYVMKNKYTRAHTQQYWIWGSVATVAGAVILFQAVGKFRQLSYEIFLYLHFALAFIFLVGAWIHLAYMSFQPTLYAMAAVWGFDRFARLVRILHFGVRTASASVVTSDIIKVVIPKHKYWKLYPGAFGYIYFLRPTVFWQSHPFSIIGSEDGKHVLLYVKAKEGATGTIMKYLQGQDGKTADMKVLFEGPYGSYHSVNHYEVALFIGTSVGMTGVFPYARDCLNSSNSRVKAAKLYWVVQNMDIVECFMEELKYLQQFEKIETIIYITRQNEIDFGDSSSGDDLYGKSSTNKESSSSMSEFFEKCKTDIHNIEFRYGRPDLGTVVKDDVAGFKGMDIGIMTCGHGTICDQVRKCVADISLSRSNGVVDYLEELQVW